jgi:hypothetical protein
VSPTLSSPPMKLMISKPANREMSRHTHAHTVQTLSNQNLYSTRSHT